MQYNVIQKLDRSQVQAETETWQKFANSNFFPPIDPMEQDLFNQSPVSIGKVKYSPCLVENTYLPQT